MNMKRGYNRKPTHEPAHEPVQGQVQQDVRTKPIAPQGLSRKSFTSSSAFDIDPAIVADFKERGYTLEFKVATVLGEEMIQRQNENQQNMWEPVDAEDAPGIMPAGYTGKVRMNGYDLCARPTYLCKKALDEYHNEALAQVSSQNLNSVVDKEMGDAPRMRPRLTRTIESAD